MERDQAAARQEVRAALQHRRTHRLAGYEDLGSRRHELVALLASGSIVVCDRTVRKPRQPIGCVAVLSPAEVSSVGALVAEYLRWAPLSEEMGIREVSPEDVGGESHEGAWMEASRRLRWKELCGEMTAACREALDQRPRRRKALAA
jgi:hypothetical protein